MGSEPAANMDGRMAPPVNDFSLDLRATRLKVHSGASISSALHRSSAELPNCMPLGWPRPRHRRKNSHVRIAAASTTSPTSPTPPKPPKLELLAMAGDVRLATSSRCGVAAPSTSCGLVDGGGGSGGGGGGGGDTDSRGGGDGGRGDGNGDGGSAGRVAAPAVRAPSTFWGLVDCGGGAGGGGGGNANGTDSC